MSDDWFLTSFQKSETPTKNNNSPKAAVKTESKAEIKPESDKPKINNNNNDYKNSINTNYNNEEKKENDSILHQTAEKIRMVEAKIIALKKEYPTCTYYLNLGLKYGGYVAIGVGAAIAAPVSVPAAIVVGKLFIYSFDQFYYYYSQTNSDHFFGFYFLFCSK